MISGGLESVLIGHPVDGYDNAVGVREGVAAFGNGAALFGRLADLLLRSALLYFGAVLGFESVGR